MATVSDYLNEALRMIGVLAEGDTASAEQGADGLVRLNDLKAELADSGIDLGLPSFASTTDTIVVPEGDRLTFKALLAVAMCPDYSRQPPDVVVAQATSGYSRMLTKYMSKEMQEIKMDHLPRGAASPVFNIVRGF